MMPQIDIIITNIFTNPDKFIAVKRIIIIIEFYIHSKTYQEFHTTPLQPIQKKSFDDSIHLNMMFILCIFEDILPNVSDYT